MYGRQLKSGFGLTVRMLRDRILPCLWMMVATACVCPQGIHAAEVDPQHPLAPAIEHAQQSQAALAKIQDYEAVYSKRELIEGKLISSLVRLKLREEPYSVYMQFETPHKGREVIYFAGKNNGMLLAHETGIRAIAGTVSLAPDSDDALEENRYPITMMGMRKMLDKLVTQWEAEAQFGEVDVKFYPNARMGDVECKVIESRHPTPRKQFKFQMSRLYIEKTTALPVRLEQWAFPSSGNQPVLAEEYTYSKVRTNLGLTDQDFDHTNPNYAFPR